MKRVQLLAIALMIACTSGVAAQQTPIVQNAAQPTIQPIVQPAIQQEAADQAVVESPMVTQPGEQAAVTQQPTVAQPYYSGCDAPATGGCDSIAQPACATPCGTPCDNPCASGCDSNCGSGCGNACGNGCGSACGRGCGRSILGNRGSACGSGCDAGCCGCGSGNDNVYQSCGIDDCCGCGNGACRGGCRGCRGGGFGSCLGGGSGDPLRCGVQLLIGFEGWANRADDNRPNNFGSRLGFNFGRDIGRQVGVQFGMNWGAYNWAGRSDGADLSETKGEENHVYTTLGFYRRSDMDNCDRLSFAMAWDYLLARNFSEDGNDHLDMNQVRMLVGYALDSRNEVGFWGAYGVDGEVIIDGDNPGGIVPIRIVDQYNTYWRAHWRSGGETMLFAGIPARGNNVGDFIVGLNVNAPLNQRCEVVGNWHYIHDSGTGNSFGNGGVLKEFAQPSWDVFVGLQFYPGNNAARRNISGNRHVPMLPVAHYGTMTFQPPATADF